MSRKNPFKGAIVLTVIAALLTGLFFLLDPYFEDSEKTKEEATLLFGGLDRNEIYEIHIQNGQSEIWIKKQADKKDSWTVSENNTDSFEADSSSVAGIISTLLAARRETEVPGIKAQDALLSPPRFVVEITHGKGANKNTVSLGKDTPVDYLVYARWSDKPEIFLTSRSLRFGVDKRISELRNKKLFNFSLSEFKSFKVEALNRKEFQSLSYLDFNKDDNGDWFAHKETKKTDLKIPLRASELASFVSSIKKLSVKDFRSETGEKSNEFNLRNPIMRFTLVRNDKPEVSEVWNISTRTFDQTKVFYLNQKDSKSVYEIAASFKDTFDVNLIKFRETKITDIAQADVKSFNIQIPKSFDLLLSKTESGSWNAEWTMANDKTETRHKGPAKMVKVQQLLKKLTQIRAEAFFDSASAKSIGLGNPNRIVEIAHKSKTLDGEKDKTSTLFFGRKRHSGDWPLNAESMISPASVKIDLAAILPADIKEYAIIKKVSPENNLDNNNSTEAGAGKAPAAKKGKKVKLEATVKTPKEITKLPAPITKAGHRYTAKLKLSNEMTLEMEFDSEKAPYTVSNFLHLARNNFYNDVVYHRVIPDFVIQGGDPTGTGSGGPGYKFDNEDNDLKHQRGSLSMAHAGRNTNGSQFFIVLQPQPHLDGLHTVFGKITKGTEQLDNIPQGTKMVTVEVFEEAL